MIAYKFQEFIMILVFRMSYKVTGREPQHKLNVVFINLKIPYIFKLTICKAF